MTEQEIVALLKEQAGLKMHCAEYKRKYKALDRVLGREIRYRIEGIKTQYPMLANRLQRSDDKIEKAEIRAILRYMSKELMELERICDMCKEVTK